MQSCTTCFYKGAVLQQFSTFQAQVKDREGFYVQNVVQKELLTCEETVMHVKCHDQVFNALEPLPYSLFFSVELHIILQSLYDNSLISGAFPKKDSRLICNGCILSSTHTHITDEHEN